MILKTKFMMAFHRTTWEEKGRARDQLGDRGSVVKSSQGGVCGNKRWQARRAVKEEDTSRLISWGEKSKG